MADASISDPATMNQRPLSPHLGVYKFMYTMSLSILHRITGAAATVGFLAFVWWLMALASGPEAYARALSVLASPLAKLLLAGFTFSFIYHFCNGIRHLVWDTGRGLERAQARRSGAVVIVVAVLLTALVVWLGCTALGIDLAEVTP
jgi:succinate dehydrogenase / fumarate reductase cytochrome b subunit